ncbi:hypothetical protein [Moraxella canis]|nr:hypothetical protein [Moraxella canis]
MMTDITLCQSYQKADKSLGIRPKLCYGILMSIHRTFDQNQAP